MDQSEQSVAKTLTAPGQAAVQTQSRAAEVVDSAIIKGVGEAPMTPEKKTEGSESELERRYSECLNKIFSWAVFRKKEAKERKELNLDQMTEFAKMFGDPHKNNFKIVHVAGTNGKGSVSLKTARALQHLGFKTGLFTSPHISTFRERIQINGELCPMESIVETCETIFKEVERTDIDVRFFEVVTMIGFLEFAKAGCDYVVLECGLGAALDATNIVGLPEVICSTITSIGKDHMDVLGNSLEDIAEEKAGIIKTGIPCIVGPSCVADLVSIKQRAKDQDVKLFEVPALNSFTQENNEIADQIIKTVCNHENLQYDAKLREIITQSSQPCRFEKIKNRKETIIIDVCHNIDGFRAVIQQIKTEYPTAEKVQIVFGISKSKKLDDIMALLDQEDLITDLYLVSRPHMRLYSPAIAHKMVSELGSTKLRDLVTINDVITTTQSDSNSEGKVSSNVSSYEQSINNNVGATLDSLLKDEQNSSFVPGQEADEDKPKQILLICGSFFIMQDVRQYFGYKQDVDYE